jgi:hypothetical protein
MQRPGEPPFLKKCSKSGGKLNGGQKYFVNLGQDEITGEAK